MKKSERLNTHHVGRDVTITSGRHNREKKYTTVGFFNDNCDDVFVHHVEAVNPTLAKERTVEMINEEYGPGFELNAGVEILAVFEGHLTDVGWR
jgi:hypothetical protein